MSWRARRYGGAVLALTVAALSIAPLPEHLLQLRLAATPAVLSYEALEALPARELVPQVAALIAAAHGLPLPADLTLGLYRTRSAFTRGLIDDLGVSPRLAVELSGRVVGFAFPRAMLLLTGEARGDRVRLVAHEVMHVAQLELAGPGAQPARWIMEGSAEWAALTLLERLHAPKIGERVAVARAIASKYLADHPGFDPSSVRDPAEFRRWQARAGDLVAYLVSYALADQLVARHGVPALVAYFRAYRQSSDHVKNFQRAFGWSTDEFMAAARATTTPVRLRAS